MSSHHHTKLVYEGRYAAEVEVDLIDADTGWSPSLSLPDAQKLDEVRRALRACCTNPCLCFDKLSTNGTPPMLSKPIPFALSLSKGERRVCATGS
jgi:hypothetical protein